MNCCINCYNNIKQNGNFCSECYIAINNDINLLEYPFNIHNYIEIKTQYVKKLYFNKFNTKIINLFNINTNFKIIPIASQYLRISILNLALKEFNLSTIFLKYNCYDINMTSYMLKSHDIKYIINEKHDKYKILDLIGSLLMDPWNYDDDIIKSLYGNDGYIPETIVDIFNLWFRNKLITQKKLDNIGIVKCNCGNYIKLQDLDIIKTPYTPLSHNNCINNGILDNLCDLLEKKITITNTDIMDE
jgi:hypothetical protein